MKDTKFRSAYLKIERAAKHVDELNQLLLEKRPYTYVVETDTKVGRRATYAKRNKAVVEQATVIVGDALQNLRSALDHAYWQVVSPVAADQRAEKAIQFPFSETSARLEEAVKNRLAHKVSPEFFKFIMDLNPHGEVGGNRQLYLLHQENGVDKHRTLIPVGDYTRLSSAMIRDQVPDLPIWAVDCEFGQSHRDIEWPLTAETRARYELPGLSTGRVFDEELNVPVQIVFAHGAEQDVRPLVPTLHQLVDSTRTVVRGMEAFI